VPVPPLEEDYAATAAAAREEAASGVRRADLVLEGGGVKGIGLLGAVVEMVGQGWTFPRVAGTSAGAIVGALVAAYVHTGHDVTDLVEVMERLDYRKFRDTDLVGRLGVVGRGIDLLVHDGVYKGDYLVDWLEAELERVGVRTFADLRIEDDPGTSLLPQERYRLVVMASDVSRGQLVRLPWDYRHYGLPADQQRVAEAVRASMSYPFFFRPVTMDVAPEAGGGRVTLIDGGMLSNFPVEIFDRSDGRPPRWPTFGVKLSARPAARQVSRPVDGPLELALACLHTLLDAHDAYHLDDLHVTERTVFVDTARVSTLDFDIDRETQHLLYTNGRTAAASFLATWPPADHRRREQPAQPA
jgi:NTE family protein